jgi:hypothetical protein
MSKCKDVKITYLKPYDIRLSYEKPYDVSLLYLKPYDVVLRTCSDIITSVYFNFEDSSRFLFENGDNLIFE